MGLLRTGLVGAIGYQMGKKGHNNQQQNATPPPPQQHYYYPPGYQPQMNYMGGAQQYQQQPQFQPQPQNGYPQYGQPQYGQQQTRSMNVEGSAPPPYVQGSTPANRRDEKSPAAGSNPF